MDLNSGEEYLCSGLRGVVKLETTAGNSGLSLSPHVREIVLFACNWHIFALLRMDVE